LLRKRAVRTANRRTGSKTVRFRTFSQAPQAVRSAGGRRWDWALPAGAPAGGTLQADKSDTLRLTVQVHGLRNVSTTAATWAVVRSHSSPPQVEDIVHDASTKFSADCFALRITNKISRVGNPEMFASRAVEPRKGKAHDNGLRRGCIAPQRHAADRHEYICLGEIGGYTASGNLVRY
jgi:hypothetical protein